MTHEEKEQLRAEIKTEIAELKARIEELKSHSGPVEPDKALGRLSRLDEMSAKSVHQAALRNAQERLQKLEYKLVTIGTPLFHAD